MASTDLAVVASQLPAYLQGAAPGTTEEFTSGIGASFPLAFLSTRGKEFRLRKDGQELNTRQREVSAVFVAARGAVSKRYYEKQYSSGSTEAPDCSSKDGETPDVAHPVAPSCRNCPNNLWGSRITDSGKEGKACSDYKRVILWLVGLTDEPVVLDVAATSLKAPKGQQHTVLMLGDYLTQLAKHGMDPTQVVTKVTFTDAEYPQLSFNFERLVSEEEFKTVLDLRGSDDVRTVLDDDVFEPDGSIKESDKPAATGAEATTGPPASQEDNTPPPEPEPEKESALSIPAFPGKATIMKNEAGEMTIAEDENGWALAWKEGYRPQDSKPVGQAEAAQEAKPEPAAQEPAKAPQEAPAADSGGDSGGDLLAAVSQLLGGQNS